MWFSSKSCQSKARLVGKTVIVTGANTGIGKETVRDLYRRGARVILACRDLAKADEAIEEVKKTPPSKPEREQFKGEPGELVRCKLNLNSLESVRECAKHISATEPFLHILVNNAGVMLCPYGKTEDGYETQFGVNHLGHFLLTLLLLPKLKASAPGCRIVNVSSMAYERGKIHFDDLNWEKSYSPMKAYSQSKLANIMFTRELNRRLKEAEIEGVTVYSLHPGVIATELGRHMDSTVFRGARSLFRVLGKPFIKTPELGAQTTLHCAVDEEAGKESGLYYKECSVTKLDEHAEDDATAAKLWDVSLDLVGLQAHENLAEILSQVERELSKGASASN